MNRTLIIISIVAIAILAASILIINGSKSADKNATIATPTMQQAKAKNTKLDEFPSAMTETMDRQAMLSCGGGQEVNLWLYPTSDMTDNRARAKVACGQVRVFNKFYNKNDNLTFYALETKDLQGKLTYGWVTDDFISFK